jgi:peptidoglycan/xylan/chitin deacetylase (PgdA/CDA1 family)
VAEVRPGAIVLGHDVGARRRLVALRGLTEMINGLRLRGYTFVTVSALLGAGVAQTTTR